MSPNSRSLEKLGVTPNYLGPEDFMKVMKTTYETGKYYVKKIRIKKTVKK